MWMEKLWSLFFCGPDFHFMPSLGQHLWILPLNICTGNYDGLRNYVFVKEKLIVVVVILLQDRHCVCVWGGHVLSKQFHQARWAINGGALPCPF